jgi:hypothetical protein
VTGSVDSDDPDVAGAMEVAMPEDAFWELIAVLDGGNTEEDVARLSAELAARTVDDLVAFDARDHDLPCRYPAGTCRARATLE